MTKKPLRVGIIGCGLMGGIHSECFDRAQGCEMVGYFNPTRSKAETLAKRFGGVVFDSAQELIDSNLDAVCIAGVQQFHAEQVIAAAKAGKHILCEKPLALLPAELDAMEKAVTEAGRAFAVVHQLRFHPVVEWVLANKSKLGPVFHLEIEMALRITATGGRCWSDYRSGGFFMELGCHLADLSRFLMGEVRHVSANTVRLDPARVTEDFTQCLLQFESNAVGSIIASANHRLERQGLLRGRMLGQKGRIDFSIYPYRRSLNGAALVVDGGKSVFVPDTEIDKMPNQFPPSPTAAYAGFFDVYQRQVDAFVKAALGEGSGSNAASFDDGRRAIEIVLAAYASQAIATERSNFTHGLQQYRADEMCHPVLEKTKV